MLEMTLFGRGKRFDGRLRKRNCGQGPFVISTGRASHYRITGHRLEANAGPFTIWLWWCDIFPHAEKWQERRGESWRIVETQRKNVTIVNYHDLRWLERMRGKRRNSLQLWQWSYVSGKISHFGWESRMFIASVATGMKINLISD